MRAILVGVMALLLAGMVVRNAFVDAYAERNPVHAAAIWPGHPSANLGSGLVEVGVSAASARPVNPATVRRMLAAAAKEPLAPEPFLVRGVAAQVAGDDALALRAFLEARNRDPRAIAARYFLAGHYVTAGQVPSGLAEISALTRLVPQSQGAVAPYLAAFARAPGGAVHVRNLLRKQPELEPLLLNLLAANPRDRRLVLYLWSGRRGSDSRGWQERLVNALVQAGRYGEARSDWARFNPGEARSGELADPNFEGRVSPPFGWSLASGPAGVAEPEGGGRLHILYYGRDDLVLASQLMMLRPGAYRLAMRIEGAGPAAKSLAWTVRCLPASRELARISLEVEKAGPLAANFSIPAQGCEVQRLELAGTAPDLPEQADLTIAALRLSRSGR